MTSPPPAPLDPPQPSTEPPLNLAEFAAVSAKIAEGDRTETEVLADHKLDKLTWLRVSAYWNNLIMEELFVQGANTLQQEYDQAFMETQDTLAPIPEMEPEEWADLQFELSTGDSAEVLKKRELRRADQLRLSRFWAKKLGKNPPLAKRYSERYYLRANRHKT
jgi:hypothetical protein